MPSWASPSSPAGHDLAPEDEPLIHLAATCAQAEGLGADALWACDHLFWHGPALECMVALTVAATATRAATLGTCVVQLPLRRAAAVAKQAASLQVLSQGRFVLGVGVGSHAGEYEQVGEDFTTRGRRLDDGIAELRRSWASGHGARTGDTGPDAGTAQRYRQLPEPPPVPVWVGGSSEAALRRAAGLADGWMPLFLDVAEYGAAVERLAKEVDAAGREAGAVARSIVLFVDIDDDPVRGTRQGTSWMSSLYGIPARAFERHLVHGTAAEVAAAVAAYQDAGADHVAVYVTADEPLDQFGRLMDVLARAGARTTPP
jgi:alkanesulfonate monooxygenase SsuD/methylene tetrahydromethanopterin reductase-like flavin-dependent oxidoreductase (luciferase family)